jgi:hypothetical protein
MTRPAPAAQASDSPGRSAAGGGAAGRTVLAGGSTSCSRNAGSFGPAVPFEAMTANSLISAMLALSMKIFMAVLLA